MPINTKIILYYDKGSIVISGINQIPYSVIDPRTNQLRALALHYLDIITYLQNSGIQYEDNVMELIPIQNLRIENINLSLRAYQKKAIENWIKAGKKGCIILPTGSGKTIIAIKLIEIINSSTLIVVPTLDLMEQWTKFLSKYFQKLEIGNIGGGIFNITGITVSTYDSAYIRSSFIGNKFAFVIFDELHHLAAPGYRTIAEQFASPYRLGLTATYEREDNLHLDFPRLVGGIVYQSSVNELARDKHLASFTVEKRYVKLLPEEELEYQKNYDQYLSYLHKLGIRYDQIGFQKLIMISGKNQYARNALLARNKALDIALNSQSKIAELRKILSENPNRKTIIFTQHNKLVYLISNNFLIPFITHKSSKQEREDALNGFRDGRYRVLVTSKVLDEGIDVPDAELGIIVSGTGSKREFIQRLGRLLRTKPNFTNAKLIEIISSGTSEINTSVRRKQALKNL
ncbi:MAG TPA: DEAD/DEAH box helicase family protein [Nitrososphaeraceae archaeon]|nr:DEAD/DEAH box helicase family protein [Nitrososphaeraceae archaeon]